MAEPRATPARAELSGIRALVFDVDGTLYHHEPVRRAMLGRLARAALARPRQSARVLRGLSAYRKAQEELRAAGGEHADLGAAQIERAAARARAGAAELQGWVEHWMEREPLDLVGAARRVGLAELLGAARAAGLRLGVFSDYPPLAKLEQLGVAGAFDAVAWAQQHAIGRFKPDPKGLAAVLTALGVEAGEALYVGDRAEVDAAAARAAGMRCAILPASRARARARPTPGDGWFPIAGFAELGVHLFG